MKLARLGVSGEGAEGTATPIPPLDDPLIKEIDLAPIQEGLSYIRVTYHTGKNEYLYEVIEPPMSSIEKTLLEQLRVTLIDQFQPLPELDAETKRLELRKMVDDQLQAWELSPTPRPRDA